MKRVLLLIILFIAFMWSVPQAHAKTKTLQQLIDETPENGTLQLSNVHYKENIVIHKSITIKGSNHILSYCKIHKLYLLLVLAILN